MNKIKGWANRPKFWHIMTWLWVIMAFVDLTNINLWWATFDLIMACFTGYYFITLLEKNNE